MGPVSVPAAARFVMTPLASQQPGAQGQGAQSARYSSTVQFSHIPGQSAVFCCTALCCAVLCRAVLCSVEQLARDMPDRYVLADNAPVLAVAGARTDADIDTDTATTSDHESGFASDHTSGFASGSDPGSDSASLQVLSAPPVRRSVRRFRLASGARLFSMV